MNKIFKIAGIVAGFSLLALGAAIPAQADTELTPIINIHGNQDTPTMLGQEVTVKGVVTAAYPTGNFNGYYIQTPGTGGEYNPDRKGSDAIFVYVGFKGIENMPKIGDCVEMRGTVAQHPSKPKKDARTLTQLTNTSDLKNVTDCAPVKPTVLPALPATEEQKEALEGMLVQPEGNYIVTDNYKIGQFGELTLANSDKPLPQATDVAKPGEPANKVEAENKIKEIRLDDGSSWNFAIKWDKKQKKWISNTKATHTPLPYLTQMPGLRVGAKVTFQHPMILTEEHGWALEPTSQVTGKTSVKDLPASFSDTRTAAPKDVLGKDGDIKVSTFNVLNYFTDLGETDSKCKDNPTNNAYVDREGNPVTTRSCDVRGAWRKADLERQQAKIVKAITVIDADVFALEEIENSARYGKERDTALNTLVAALNAAKGKETWKAVPSPKVVPNNGDAIRIAMIYKPAKLKLDGASVILDDPAFTDMARSPLAQKFTPIAADGQQAKSFVLIGNHFKSKGTFHKPTTVEDMDHHDGQAAYNGIRVKQAQALVKFAKQWKDDPVLLVGDFNAYSKEDPVKVIHEGGYSDIEADGHSYVYAGRVGSMDHGFANAAAKGLITGADVWEINAQESVMLEYSRYNNNVTNFYKDDVYRASDHNPEVFGLNVINSKKVSDTPSIKAPAVVREVNVDKSTIVRGDYLTLTASGFAPGDLVVFEVDSQIVGEAKANADGVAVYKWKSPADFSRGEHQVYAYVKGSSEKIGPTAFMVKAVEGERSKLAMTGSSGLVALIGSIVLLGVGVMVIVVRRRN